MNKEKYEDLLFRYLGESSKGSNLNNSSDCDVGTSLDFWVDGSDEHKSAKKSLSRVKTSNPELYHKILNMG